MDHCLQYTAGIYYILVDLLKLICWSCSKGNQLVYSYRRIFEVVKRFYIPVHDHCYKGDIKFPMHRISLEKACMNEKFQHKLCRPFHFRNNLDYWSQKTIIVCCFELFYGQRWVLDSRLHQRRQVNCDVYFFNISGFFWYDEMDGIDFKKFCHLYLLHCTKLV